MKTIFDKATRDELTARINSIKESNTTQWGKMNIYQMLKHCTIWDEWILGKNNATYKQAFMGRIFGKMALKKMIKDEKPLDRNIPTSNQFKVKEKNEDVSLEQKKWITLINDYEHYSNPNFIHDFFGKMEREQVGILAYKHTDHHLRQFNI
jgi:Protein of unknown function (DUF1569)